MKSQRRGWLRLAVAALLVCAVPAGAGAASSGNEKGKPKAAVSGFHDTDAAPDYDVRSTRSGRRSYAAPLARRRAAQAGLKRSLGAGAIVKVDPVTGTPAWVASRGGFLTGRGKGGARATALGFVRDHAAAFGLDRDDLAGLELAHQYTTKRGLTHIEFVQKYRGIAAFDNGLRVNLAKGRIVNVSGSPQPDLAVASTTPRVSPESAARRALADVGARRPVEQRSQKGAAKRTVLSGRNLATLVLFVEGERTRLAWNVIATKDVDEVYRTLIAADSGEVLKRTNLVAHASGSVFRYYPGAPQGGTQTPATFPASGDDAWVGFGNNFTRLRGDNAHTYTDPGDTYHLSDLQCDQNGCTSNGTPPASGDEIPPSAGSGTPDAAWTYPQVVDTNNQTSDRFCPTAGCTWYAGAGGIDAADYDAPFVPGNNWQANRRQNGTQVHFFVNNFHDFTQNDAGIGFDDASGNFEETASGENPGDPAAPVGGDSVRAQANDGAATFNPDFPLDDHMNNANMLTLPEKDQNGPVPFPFKAPQMQMFLFSDFACNGSCGAGITDVNGGDDGAILYHEFVHGLSTRLVDPLGVGALDPPQGGAMGEAWSDVYAMDYLNAQGLQPDTPAKGEVVFGTYEGMEGVIRTQPQDCPVAANPAVPDAVCPQTQTTCCYGGYTYGQFGTINASGAEVHDDGEIWAETLWELRQVLISALGPGNGQFVWRAIVTDAMRLAPADPDVLDFLVMRDAILQANQVDGFGQANCERIWDVFARRGMGADASSGGGADTSPNEGFADPGAAACVPPPDGGDDGGGGGDGGGGVTPPPARPSAASLRSARSSIRVSRSGRFSYSFRAQGGIAGSSLFRTRKKAVVSRRAHVTIARKSFRASAGGRVTQRIKLSRKNLRILRRNRRLLLRVTVTVRNAGGSATARKNLTLLAPKRR